MRLLRLDLTAFGCFTDKSLEFDPTKSFHLIYGLNEAGKSTALCAVHDLLFGVEERTLYNFLHDYKQMRIGGLIEGRNGFRQEIVRLKARKDSLRDAADSPLPESILRELTGGADSEFFERQFGIDHQQLEVGGREISKGEGDVGQALFATGLGNINFKPLLERLRSDAAELFKAGGSKPKINGLIQSYKGAKKQIGIAAIPPADFRRLNDEKKQAKSELELNQRAVREKNTVKERLERIQRSLPKLERRKYRSDRLDHIGNLPHVPLEESREREQLEQIRKLTQNGLAKTIEQIDRETKRFEALNPNDELTAQSNAVKNIVERGGSIKKAANDRTGLQREFEAEMLNVRRLYGDLQLPCELDEIHTMRLTRPERTRLNKLAGDFRTLSSDQKNVEKNLKQFQGDLKAAQEDLKQLPEPVEIGTAEAILVGINEHGDLEKQLRDAKTDLYADEATLKRSLERLHFWVGESDALVALQVPSIDTIERFAKELDRVEKAENRIESNLSAEIERLEGFQSDLSRLQHNEKVPTRDTLSGLRQKRDHGWQLVRRAWLQQEDVSSEGESFDDQRELPEAYEAAVADADDAADLMRDKAEAVARTEQLLSDIKRVDNKIEKLKVEQTEIQEKKCLFQNEWNKVWSGLTGDIDSPRGMRDWLTERDRIVQLHDAIGRKQFTVNGVEDQISANEALLRKTLIESFDVAESDLVEQTRRMLIKRLTTCLSNERQTATNRNGLTEKISNSKRNIAEQKELSDQNIQKVTDWQEDWNKAVKRFGLVAAPDPGQAAGFLDNLDEMFKSFDAAQSLKRRIDAIDIDTARFKDDVRLLCQKVAVDLMDTEPVGAIATLNDRLEASKQEAAQKEESRDRLSDLGNDKREAETSFNTAQSQLNEMMRKYGMDSLNLLQELHERASEARRLKLEIQEIEGDLSTDSGGERIENWAMAVKEIDPDALPSQIAEINSELLQLNRQADDINRRIGTVDAELKQMDGSAAAAEAADTANALLAEFPPLLDRYIQLSLAEFLLRKEMERYREQHQDPILARAGEIFHALTLKSFSKLVADIDEKGTPVLFGVRPDNKHVTVSGMSDGTVDQLYLSLRIASLENYLQSNEPLPFIIDDVLIKFDDRRAAACFKVLADLSNRVQVIYFTHQDRHRELARSVLQDQLDLLDL